ncbi:hypothetical protein OIDMADRAFT_176348 [Oidiodendron maius Zn]|uniref:Uncharacterized protein n=1 Tax=Oidiodendron maius (strain Zn) TaxID=913774 RepID=A0A0C3DVZ4_OIDMZ|nr:hypothetical protein OIDMADRAFT_176348 [Oidiodendron maius Zn]
MIEPHSAAHWHTGVVQLSFTDQYIIHDWLTEARAGSDLGANERVNWQVTAARNLSKISAAKPRNRRTKYGHAHKAFLAVPQGPICTRDKQLGLAGRLPEQVELSASARQRHGRQRSCPNHTRANTRMARRGMETEGEQWRPGLNERGKWRRVEFGDLYEKELEGQ